MAEYLDGIIARKQLENARRRRHQSLALRLRQAAGSQLQAVGPSGAAGRGARAVHALRRSPGEPLRVIAEIKRRSPSAGQIRPWEQGDVPRIAGAYEAAGAAAVSVLADGPGFGGSPLDLRRAARAVQVPLLFKEFVMDPLQVELAQQVGASMVLLLVRALPQSTLIELVDACLMRGLAPVVEAADPDELDRALATRATVVGVNSRDLRTFQVDTSAALAQVATIPQDRVAVFMSGIRDPALFAQVQATRADAVLIGEYLMRGADPGEQMARLRQG